MPRRPPPRPGRHTRPDASPPDQTQRCQDKGKEQQGSLETDPPSPAVWALSADRPGRPRDRFVWDRVETHSTHTCFREEDYHATGIGDRAMAFTPSSQSATHPAHHTSSPHRRRYRRRPRARMPTHARANRARRAAGNHPATAADRIVSRGIARTGSSGRTARSGTDDDPPRTLINRLRW